MYPHNSMDQNVHIINRIKDSLNIHQVNINSAEISTDGRTITFTFPTFRDCEIFERCLRNHPSFKLATQAVASVSQTIVLQYDDVFKSALGLAASSSTLIQHSSSSITNPSSTARSSTSSSSSSSIPLNGIKNLMNTSKTTSDTKCFQVEVKKPKDADLLSAVRHSRLEEVKQLLDAKADIHCVDSITGDTPLHIATTQNSDEVVKLLLDQGANTFITNYEFKSPLQKAAENPALTTATTLPPVLNQLLYKRTTLDKRALEAVINFCHEFYYINDEKKANDNQRLLDFCVSYMAGVDVAALLRNKHAGRKTIGRSNHDVYLAHLKSFVGYKDNISIERWYWEEFLPLRIRSFFEILIKAEIGNDKAQPLPDDLRVADKSILKAGWSSIIEALKQEILVELESLHIHNCVLAVSGLPNGQIKNTARLALAKNIAHRLQQLPNGRELSFAGGWTEHAVYVSFMKLADSSLVVRIDNAGYGADAEYWKWTNDTKFWVRANYSIPHYTYYTDFPAQPWHPSAENWARLHPSNDTIPQQVYSCVLGVMPTIAYDPNQATLPYLVDLIAAYEASSFELAFPKIYNLEGQFAPSNIPTPEVLLLSPNKFQSASNCVVENHQIGLQHRLTPYLACGTADSKKLIEDRYTLYRWIKNEELQLVSREPQEIKMDYSSFWQRYLQPRDFPIEMRQVFKSHLKVENRMRFLFDLDELPSGIQARYVELSLVEEIKTIQDERERGDEDKRKNPKVQHKPVISKEIKSVDVSDIYNKYLRGGKSLVVQGHAGMGKSTFCRYLAKQWADDEPLLKAFAWVFHIPLRNLNIHRYPAGSTYTEIDIIKNECFPKGAFPKFAESMLAAILQDDNKKKLWLLDGQDELLELPPHLKEIVEALFKKPYVIISSRHHYPDHNYIPKRLEIVGFNDDNIHRYINNFYNDGKEAEKLTQFLQTNRDAYIIAKTPIILELICAIWYADGKTQLEQAGILTRPKLYHIIVVWLLHRFFYKQYQFKIRDESILMRRLPTELCALEKIAFRMLPERTLNDETFKEIIPQTKIDSALQKDIIGLGILAPSRKMQRRTHTLSLAENKGEDAEISATVTYEFIHYSFQEFFVARHLINALQTETNSSQYTQALTFIKKEKYNTTYRPIFTYMAGLLSLPNANRIVQKIFWETLHSAPFDLTQIEHICLLISCLQQVANDSNNQEIYLPIINDINRFITTFFMESYVKFYASLNLEKLLDTLKTSARVIAHPKLCQSMLTALAFMQMKPTRRQSIIPEIMDQLEERDCLKIFTTMSNMLFVTHEEIIATYIAYSLKEQKSRLKQKLNDKIFVNSGSSTSVAEEKFNFKDTLINKGNNEILHKIFQEAKNNSSHNQQRALWLLRHTGLFSDEVAQLLILISSTHGNVKCRHLGLATLLYTQFYTEEDEIRKKISNISAKDSDDKVKELAKKLLDDINEYEYYLSIQSDDPGVDYESVVSDDDNIKVDGNLIDEVNPSEFWITNGILLKTPKLRWAMDETDEKELNARKEEKNIIPVELKYSSHNVSQRVYDVYQLIRNNERNLNIEEIRQIKDKDLEWLLQHKYYLVASELKYLISAFARSNNQLLGQLIAKHVFTLGIAIVILEYNVLIYSKETISISVPNNIATHLKNIINQRATDYDLPGIETNQITSAIIPSQMNGVSDSKQPIMSRLFTSSANPSSSHSQPKRKLDTISGIDTNAVAQKFKNADGNAVAISLQPIPEENFTETKPDAYLENATMPNVDEQSINDCVTTPTFNQASLTSSHNIMAITQLGTFSAASGTTNTSTTTHIPLASQDLAQHSHIERNEANTHYTNDSHSSNKQPTSSLFNIGLGRFGRK